MSHAQLARWLQSKLPTLWPSIAVLVLGLAATLAVWEVAQRDTQRLDQAKFEANAHEIRTAIQARMAAYEQILRGGVSLFTTLGEVTRLQWADYVEHLEVKSNYPGVQGIGFAAYLQASDKDQFVARQRAQDMPNYGIRPAGERDVYVPVTYLEPRNERNLKAHGFDMWSEPIRREAMTHARDSGHAAITSKLKLASEPNQSPVFGFLVYVPVFNRALPIETPAQRALALRGFVNSPFRIDDLLRGLIGTTARQISLKIYDGSDLNPDSLMYTETVPEAITSNAALAPLPAPLVQTLGMVTHGHQWTLEFSSPGRQLAQDNTPRLLLMAGGVISLLLSALAYALTARVRLIQSSEQHYFQLANFDSLTGLPNRAMFQDRLERSLIQTQRNDSTMALLFIDVDNFKDVNDNLGHGVGDLLLKEIGARIQGCVRQVDMVARLGGDEFTVVLCDLQGPDDAGKIAQTVLEKMTIPCVLQGKPFYVSVSIGITLFPADARNSTDLLKNADQAMYAVKRQGRKGFQFFAASMQEAAVSRMRVVAELRTALERKEFFVVYQPIWDMRSGAIAKAEALIRWQNPHLGLVNPVDFIPLAEEEGLIADIGDWVFDQAARQAKLWRTSQRPEFQISVNVSPAQFRGTGFVNRGWFEHLQAMGLSGSALAVEITEGLLLKTDSDVTSHLLALRDAGIQVALDDFGTGYSSLSYLKRLDIDYIKIDRSFVMALQPDSDDLALCSAIIEMAHRLGLQVVAEGIETQQQCDLLMALGCDFGQGYLVSRPVLPEAFEMQLR